jgi:hypothetical protein
MKRIRRDYFFFFTAFLAAFLGAAFLAAFLGAAAFFGAAFFLAMVTSSIKTNFGNPIALRKIEVAYLTSSKHEHDSLTASATLNHEQEPIRLLLQTIGCRFPKPIRCS